MHEVIRDESIKLYGSDNKTVILQIPRPYVIDRFSIEEAQGKTIESGIAEVATTELFLRSLLALYAINNRSVQEDSEEVLTRTIKKPKVKFSEITKEYLVELRDRQIYKTKGNLEAHCLVEIMEGTQDRPAKKDDIIVGIWGLADKSEITIGHYSRLNTMVWQLRRNLRKESYKWDLITVVQGRQQVFSGSKNLTEKASYFLEKINKTEEDKVLSEYKEIENITPSLDWAWMLGILSIGGNVDPKGNIFVSDSDNKNLQNKFMELGERLFQTNHWEDTVIIKGERHSRPAFTSMKITRLLGDLRKLQWVQTIKNKHNWLISESKYIWKFLEGIFEARGYIYPNHGRYNQGIRFNTDSREVANFIGELLVRVGITHLRLVPKNASGEGIGGINISSFLDGKLFANNIHSVLAEKEESLNFFRKKESQRIYHAEVISIDNEKNHYKIKGEENG